MLNSNKPPKVKLIVPFGISRFEFIIKRARESKREFEEVLEQSLMDQVLIRLEQNRYTSKDVEYVKATDDLTGQVRTRCDDILRMFRKYKGVCKTLEFMVSPRDVYAEDAK